MKMKPTTLRQVNVFIIEKIIFNLIYMKKKKKKNFRTRTFWRARTELLQWSKGDIFCI